MVPEPYVTLTLINTTIYALELITPSILQKRETNANYHSSTNNLIYPLLVYQNTTKLRVLGRVLKPSLQSPRLEQNQDKRNRKLGYRKKLLRFRTKLKTCVSLEQSLETFSGAFFEE